jgi:hypothetical protein
MKTVKGNKEGSFQIEIKQYELVRIGEIASYYVLPIDHVITAMLHHGLDGILCQMRVEKRHSKTTIPKNQDNTGNNKKG